MAQKPHKPRSHISIQAMIIATVVFGIFHLFLVAQGYDISTVMPLSLAILALVPVAIKHGS